MSQDQKTEIQTLAAQCTLRPVKIEDKDLILEMRNQDHVRENMLSAEIITPENHKKWFNAMIKSSDKAFFILINNDKPAGVIGFYDLQQHAANWSFYLKSPNPPKGLGTIMCTLGLSKVFDDHDISKIRTIVLEGNIKSLKLHERLGFHKTGRNENNIELELDKETYKKILSNGGLI